MENSTTTIPIPQLINYNSDQLFAATNKYFQQMEVQGLGIDEQSLKHISTESNSKLESLREKIRVDSGITNPNSVLQVRQYLLSSPKRYPVNIRRPIDTSFDGLSKYNDDNLCNISNYRSLYKCKTEVSRFLEYGERLYFKFGEPTLTGRLYLHRPITIPQIK